MKTILAVFLFFALLGVLLYGALGSRASVDKEELGMHCLSDIQAAQESSLEKICTQEVKSFFCPYDASFDYEAPNGCEISFLEALGWR